MGNKIKPWRRRDRKHLKHAVKKYKRIPEEYRPLRDILKELDSDTANLPTTGDPVE